MTKVLLVEDDSFIAKIVSFYLEQESRYEVTWAKTAGDAMGFARRQFDVILLDVMLPDANGIQLCERLREWHVCPIIFISALDNADTIVNALEAGGDDFITKPFDNKVLVAHIEANIRRANAVKAEVAQGSIVCRGFSLDVESRLVDLNGTKVKLSPQEARILALLMRNPNRYFNADDIYQRVWGHDSFGDTRSVTVHIHNIRKKIADLDGLYIRNDWGKGYIFDPEGAKTE